MVWQGVADDDVDYWKAASSRVTETDINEWCEVVGVPDGFDLERQRRKGDGLTLLEWGGMEIIGQVGCHPHQLSKVL